MAKREKLEKNIEPHAKIWYDDTVHLHGGSKGADMKEKKTESPVFYDQADELWHYHKKYLTTDSQITFRISKEGYNTPEEAMRFYLQDSEIFSEKMEALKNKQPRNTDFRQELVNWYHNIHLATVSGSTVITSSYVLYHFILPNLGMLGDKKLDQVMAKDLNKLIQSMDQCCDTAKAQTYKFLNVFFKEILLDRKIRANPMELVTPYYFSNAQKEVPAYTKKEIATLLSYAKNTTHFFEIYLMLLGLRLGEIRGLKETDFNKREKTLHIRRQLVRQDEVVYSADGNISVKKVGVTVKAPKTESSNRIIRVPSITFDLLTQRENEINNTQKKRTEKEQEWNDTFASYICRSDTGKIKSEKTLTNALKRICTSAKLPIVSPHDLRHITATLMFEYALSGASSPSDDSSTNVTFDIYMNYVRSLSRVRRVSENLIDPFNALSKLKGAVAQ